MDSRRWYVLQCKPRESATGEQGVQVLFQAGDVTD